MNHPATLNYTEDVKSRQNSVNQSYQKINGEAITRELKTTIDSLLDNQFYGDLQRMKHHTRACYLMEPLWRAYMLSFILDMDCTNDLIRRLEESPNLIEICGFDMDKALPSRSTFDRFIISLAEHMEPVERLLDRAIDQLHQKLPEFGFTVAVDSTPVRSHSNPGRKVKSDPEAGFIVKESLSRKVWKWGYKLHLLADTTWELPIACEVTLAKESDVAHLIPLLNKTKEKFSWFKPWHVTADAGYDAGYNYKAISDLGSIPIIKMRESPQKDIRYSIDEAGIPHCRVGMPLLLQGRDKKKGMKYLCPHRAGKIKCSLLHQCTLKVAWIRPFWEYRKFCSIPRDSDAWNQIYFKRGAVERVNSKLKGHRRLNSHCHRGFAKVRLHCLMSVLSLVLTSLAEVKADNMERVRACTRKVD